MRRAPPPASSETVYRTGSLAAGFGFTANVELAQLAGCGLAHNSGLGGWVVKVTEDLKTNVEGIHAAGEITAISGAAKSLTEGRLAGFSILQDLGLLKSDEMRGEISALKKQRQRQMAFARYFNSQYSFAPEYLAGWMRRLPDDVPVCRCEEVNLGDLRRAVAEGFDTPAGLKKATRDALQLLGDHYTQRGRFAEGLEVYERLARLEPQSPLVFYNLACSYSLTDQFDRAAQALEKALSLGYRDFNWLAKDPDLRKLRKHPLYQRIETKVRQMKNIVH